jgi:hypothetical protein
VKRSAALLTDVPPGLVTVTSTVPEPGGEMATREVPDFESAFAFLLPNVTAVTSDRPVPVMVTFVPPDGRPLLGATFETWGRGS